MLKKLYIEQFVIIDLLDLDLKPGLTILTGETGAGKSILLGAMGLILGEPSTPDSIRQGIEQSVFKAVFAPRQDNPVWPFLQKKGLASPNDEEIRIHRIMSRSGNDSITVNEKPVELELLKELGEYLVEIHGQFANQSLLEPANQLNLLDLSGNFPPEIFQNVSEALKNVHRYTKALEDEKTFLARHKQQAPKIEKIYRKFQTTGMTGKGYIEKIEEEYATLLIAKETCEAFQSILSQMIAGNGVVMALSGANLTLQRQENVEREKVEALETHLSQSLESARQAVDEIGKLTPEYEIDTTEMHKLEEKLAILQDIATENKLTFEDLTEFFLEIAGKLKRLKNGQKTLEKIGEYLHKSKMAFRHHAQILSDKRKIAGEALGKAITAELPPLKLEKAQFDVVVEEDPTISWTDKGFNNVVFTGRMNPGMPFSPIVATASGGELARMILGLKVVLQEVQTTSTLVFDEVDTGIGGAAAAAVGERLSILSDNTQVLVITHSPQVASRGETHLHVSKSSDAATTTSVVNILTMDERIDEISRMLSGDKITEESQAAAKSLINEAVTSAEERRSKKAIEAKQKAQQPAPPEIAEPPVSAEQEAAQLESEEQEIEGNIEGQESAPSEPPVPSLDPEQGSPDQIA